MKTLRNSDSEAVKTPGQGQRSQWLLLLFPILAVVASLTLSYLWNEDFWWYVSTGEAVLENGGKIPDVDPFLYSSEDGIAWVFYSWLWTVVIALIQRLAGLPAVVMFHMVMATSVCILVYTKARVDRFGLVNSLAVLLFLVTIQSRLCGKSEIATWLMFAIFYWILENRDGFTWRRVLALGLLQVLWANLHGGYPLGVFLALCYSIGGWLQARFSRRKALLPAQIPPLWLPLLLLVLAVADPRMVEERLAPFGLVLGSESVQAIGDSGEQLILEWRSPFSFADSSPIYVWLFVIALVVGLASFFFVKRKSWPRMFLLLGVAVLAADAIRHLSGLSLAAALVLLSNLGEGWAEKGSKAKGKRRRDLHRTESSTVPRWLYPATCGALALTLLTAAVSLRLARPGFEAGQAESFFTMKPAMACPKAADYILEHQLPGPIFNDYQIGSYLGYRLYPKLQVFIDPRVLDPSVVVDYTKMVDSEESWKRAESQYGFRTVVLGNYSKTVRSPLGQALARDPRWRLVYLDPLATIFVKSRGASPPLRQQFRRSDSDPRVPFTDPPGYSGPVAALQRLFLHDYPSNYLIEYLAILGQLNKVSAVRELATEALDTRGDHRLILRQRCAANLALGDIEAALTDCERSYSMRTSDSQVAALYSMVLNAAGRQKDALSVLERALRVNPKDRALLALRRRLGESS